MLVSIHFHTNRLLYYVLSASQSMIPFALLRRPHPTHLVSWYFHRQLFIDHHNHHHHHHPLKQNLKPKHSYYYIQHNYCNTNCRRFYQKHYYHRYHRPPSYTHLTPRLCSELQSKLTSQAQTSQNICDLERHGVGESYHASVPPELVVTPANLHDVQSVLQFANQYRIPVIPYGAGTSLEGHVAAFYGGISLDMGIHFQNIQIPSFHQSSNDKTAATPQLSVRAVAAAVTTSTRHDDDMDGMNQSTTLPDPIAVVGAGVTRKQLNAALKHTGWHFSVDPGADATIGGMTATGASGTTAVCYGTMRDNVLAVECVLADGTHIRTGSLALKNSAGYDLRALLIGSEGTLGVITSVTVKLHPIVPYKSTIVAVFDNLDHAATAVAALKLYDIPLLRCELLDEASAEAFYKYNSKNNIIVHPTTSSPVVDHKPTLFLEVQAFSEIVLHEHVRAVQQICQDEYQCIRLQQSMDASQSLQLWTARHQLYYAAIASRPGAVRALVTDTCVPLSRFF